MQHRGMGQAGTNEHMGRRTSLVLLALLALVAVLTLFPLLSVGPITNDDLKLANAALDRGFRGVAAALWAFTRRHGRLDITQLASWYLPFAVDSFAYFKAVSLAAVAADLLLFAAFARAVFRCRRAFFLALLLSLVGLQNSWDHSGLTAFPGLLTFTFAYLMGSFLAFQRFLERGGRGWLFASAALYLLTICSYETYLLYLPVFLGLAAHAGRPPRAVLRAAAPHLGAAALQLVTWFTSHALRLGNYPGATLAPVIDAHRIASTVWHFSVSSLPGYFFLSPKYAYLVASGNGASGVLGLIASLNAGSVTKATILVGVYGFLVAHPPAPSLALSRRSLLVMATAGVLCILAPSLLPGLTAHYQAQAGHQLGFQWSYLSLFGWIWAALPLVLRVASGECRAWLRWLFVAVTMPALAFASLAVDYVNGAVATQQAQGRRRTAMVDAFLASRAFATIPNGAFVYAPSLWETIGTIDFVGAAIDPPPSQDPVYDNYWTFYFQRRSHKRVTVADRLADIPSGPGFYYLRHVCSAPSSADHLVFASVRRGLFAPDDLTADHVTIYDGSPWTERAVAGSVVAPHGEAVVQLAGGGSVRTNDLFAFRVANHRLREGRLERIEVPAQKGSIDVESVALLAGSFPDLPGVTRRGGWLGDGWMGAEASATLRTRKPARLTVEVYLPDYLFAGSEIQAVELSLDLDRVPLVSRRMARGGIFRIETNIEATPGANLRLRCGPLHTPRALGVGSDGRGLCAVIKSIALDEREQERQAGALR